ncbi:MAG: hypothetical protein ACEY3M_08720, partial [Wolbachia sp.]
PMLPLLFSLSHNYTLLAYKPHYHKSISYLIWIIMRRAITLVVTNLEGFSSSINSSLNNADWLTKRDIIRTLVK